MDEYLGFLPEYDYQSATLSETVQGNLVLFPVMSGMAELTEPVFNGFIEEDICGYGTENAVFFIGFEPIDDALPINTNLLTHVYDQMKMVPVIYDYAEIAQSTEPGIIFDSAVGILTARSFNGFMNGSNVSDVQYIYRTVGSPRRSPLDAAWIKSKDAESYIIDEVDGDIDG